MPIRARVGRHAKTGKHCQNWKDDQVTVISLLNKIPIADGGAEGAINVPTVAGYAAQGLYTAILYFQKKYLPTEPTGFIDPGSPLMAKMESLAARPPAPPPKEGAWDNIKSGSVDKALRKALSGDLIIEHEEVVDIIRATLSNGIVSSQELDDLTLIRDKSKSLSQRSKDLIYSFVSEIKSAFGGSGPYRFLSEKHVKAAEIVCDFLKRRKSTAFPKLNGDTVGIGLLMRIANPGILDQNQASLCGPAALLHNFVTDRPGEYALYATYLFEKGRGELGRLVIQPGADLKNHLPDSWKIHQTDWLTMASLRDSENWFFDYDETAREFAGITTPSELAGWFRKAGYSDVRDETNLTNITHKGNGTVDDANELWQKDYRVCLFISANMLDAADQSSRGSVFTRHWVVQRSLIDRTDDKVRLQVFTYGKGNQQIPVDKKDLSVDEFLGNFYGYVAAKP